MTPKKSRGTGKGTSEPGAPAAPDRPGKQPAKPPRGRSVPVGLPVDEEEFRSLKRAAEAPTPPEESGAEGSDEEDAPAEDR